MIDRKVAILGIVVGLIFLILFNVNNEDDQVNQKIVENTQLWPISREDKNNIEIKYIQEKGSVKNKVKDEERVVVQNEMIEYIGPKGKNISVCIISGRKKYRVKIPLGEIHLSQVKLKVVNQIVPFYSIKKIRPNQSIKIVVNPNTNTLRSVLVENEQLTDATDSIENRNIGDLPNFIITPRPFNP